MPKYLTLKKLNISGFQKVTQWTTVYTSPPENETVRICLKSFNSPDPTYLSTLPSLPRGHPALSLVFIRLFGCSFILSLLPYAGINRTQYLARVALARGWGPAVLHLLQLALFTQHCAPQIYPCGHFCLQSGGSRFKTTGS